MAKMGTKLLPLVGLKDATEYTLLEELRRVTLDPVQKPPVAVPTSDEEVAAMSLRGLIDKTGRFDYAEWIGELKSDRELNPRPYYSVLALYFSGAPPQELDDLGTSLIENGYLEGRFLVTLGSVLTQCRMLDRARRIIGIGLDQWPMHGGLHMLNAGLHLRLGNCTEAAASTKLASREMSFSPNARQQVKYLMNCGRVRDSVTLLKYHLRTWSRVMPVVASRCREFERLAGTDADGWRERG
jgi:hypothetical protein